MFHSEIACRFEARHFSNIGRLILCFSQSIHRFNLCFSSFIAIRHYTVMQQEERSRLHKQTEVAMEWTFLVHFTIPHRLRRSRQRLHSVELDQHPTWHFTRARRSNVFTNQSSYSWYCLCLATLQGLMYWPWSIESAGIRHMLSCVRMPFNQTRRSSWWDHQSSVQASAVRRINASDSTFDQVIESVNSSINQDRRSLVWWRIVRTMIE